MSLIAIKTSKHRSTIRNAPARPAAPNRSCLISLIIVFSILGLLSNREELADEGGYPLFTRAKIAMAGQIKLAAV